MALDFYDLNDTHHKRKLFEIEHKELEELEEVLSKFKNKTGLTIDPYGGIRIYRDHAMLIASIIKDQIDKLNAKSEIPKKESLVRIYTDLSSVSDGFLVIGD